MIVLGCSAPKETDDDVAVPRCAGRTRRTEEQCSFRPKAGSSFCERHARQFREKGGLDPEFTYDGPSSSSPTASFSLRRRRSKEVMNVGDSMSTRERRSLTKAKDLFNDILNAGMLRGKGNFWLTLVPLIQLFLLNLSYVVLLLIACEIRNIILGLCYKVMAQWAFQYIDRSLSFVFLYCYVKLSLMNCMAWCLQL